MDLNPDNIKEHIGKIGQREAITILKEWISNSIDLDLRKKALKLIRTIDDGKNFRFFEQLFLSDENSEIRIITGDVLKEKYINHKSIVSLLEFTLFNINRYEQKLLSVEILNEINSNETRKIIKNYLQKFIESKLKNKGEEFPKEIFSDDFNLVIPESLLEICFNLILYAYYIDTCGYNVTLRNGYIILLNCEGSNLGGIKDIDALNKLSRLEHLIVKRNKFKKINGLKYLKNLRVLNLADNNIERIENLEKLENLEELELSYNKIRTIENLESLKKLKKLNLEVNLIEDIKNLDGLSNLEELNLSNNKISGIMNLVNLSKLKKLNLSFNNINKIKELEELTDLIWLYLNNNYIKKTEGLDSLRNLKGLYLSNNEIERMENLENLINLSQLSLSNNKIQKINGLDNLKKLNTLYLDDNIISRLEGISNLKNLNQLYLVNNQISEYRNIYVENLEKLYYIFLNGNPLTPQSWLCYKKKMTKYP